MNDVSKKNSDLKFQLNQKIERFTTYGEFIFLAQVLNYSLEQEEVQDFYDKFTERIYPFGLDQMMFYFIEKDIKIDSHLVYMEREKSQNLESNWI